VKDRVASAMIEAAERDGRISPGDTLVEPTSGNTGIGLALVAAVKGYRLIITMPDDSSSVRRSLLRRYGAQVILTPAGELMQGAIERAKKIVAEEPRAFMLQQFENEANPAVHGATTAREILEATGHRIDAFVAGVGTGGTITGVGEVLKAKKPGVKIVAVEPAGSPVLSGGAPGPHKLQGIGAGFVPAVLNTKIIDEIIQVKEADSGPISKQVNTQDGVPIGISSGAAVWAALELAKRAENKGKTIVAIIPSCAERYLSSWLFADVEVESDNIDALFAK
jgi:cysteine synthase A